MLSVLPELRSSVHRPVHRRHLVRSVSSAESDRDREARSEARLPPRRLAILVGVNVALHVADTAGE